MAGTLAEVFSGSATTLAETGFHFTRRRGGQDILLRAPDLATAQRERRRIQSSAGEAPSVLLEVEAVVAESYSQARLKLAESGDRTASEQLTIRYVGTADGLAGLIADIAAAEVADGVVIAPVPLSDAPTLILAQTIPWLQERGLIADVVNLNG